MKIALLIIAAVCGLFGRHRHAAPQRPATVRAAGKWYATPHYDDGYWVERTAEQMAAKTGIKAWRQYPFSVYRWEWPGITEADATWQRDDSPGKTQEKPPRQKWMPDYDPFAPGQRMNL